MNPIQNLYFLLPTIACLVVSLQSIQAFILPIHHVPKRSSSTTHLHSSAPSDVDDSEPLQLTTESSTRVPSPDAMIIKQKLLTLCASYDRGFGASPRAKLQVDELIKELESLNPTPVDAAQGIEGKDDHAHLTGE